MNDQDLLESAQALARALNEYEAHILYAVNDPVRGVHLPSHLDVRACADESRHDPWHDVVFRWPGYDAKGAGVAGSLSGAEVAVLSSDRGSVMVRYVATDHRWVVDPAWQPATA